MYFLEDVGYNINDPCDKGYSGGVPKLVISSCGLKRDIKSTQKF